MFVKFVSDGSVQKAGFSATFIKELDECELKDHGCQHECTNTLGGYQCSCHIGYELHSDKKTCESKQMFCFTIHNICYTLYVVCYSYALCTYARMHCALCTLND